MIWDSVNFTKKYWGCFCIYAINNLIFSLLGLKSEPHKSFLFP